MIPQATTPKLDHDLYQALSNALCLAVLAGRRGLTTESSSVFSAWSSFVPGDGLGPMGAALGLAGRGDREGAKELLKACAPDIARAELVQEILADLDTPTEKPKPIPRGPASLRRF
ncbi:hypothetical protein AIOL_001339 [Candidatus Rhodobacter oscarellae]|uniref:Uncharacterized protein n=1 Tax=Candidatus Rhodobacter oscarellae TaxID=1675527 RepID=A0A0J9E127_9RHOB|nr:hypothetical protein [Candidatus Rhodobacter lobularis]KMW56387.1 hypothetical protein AIOL_001339 [Candidatus Rhodobacter lobularis]